MIVLNGHSGCSVTLLDCCIVRKTSSSKEYNDRLITQMKKQKLFTHEDIFTPKILNEGYDKFGNFYFDMEYIKGDSLCNIFKKESLPTCEYFLEQIKTIHKDRNKKENILSIVLKKLKELNCDNENIQILTQCDWTVDIGFCHGDLTFENIIISKNKIYLIDFLDSFVDSPIIDEAKLLQDCFCYWSFKESYIPKRKLIHVCDKFNTKQHYCMLLIHLLRILPYSSIKIKENVLCMIEKVKHKINQF